MLNKILLPVDGSAQAMNAAKMAAELAGMAGAKVVLIHCYSGVPMVMEGQVFPHAVDEIVAISNEMLSTYRDMLKKSGVRYTDKVLEGLPAEVIVDVAKDEGCDMIVMGCRGRSDIEGLLVGGVTSRVLQTAPCPVLVTR
ncbi:MAG: universal stress protein [Desulfovibrionaceae bacterium]|nr:universal stress protein [Desulfovibrionaceae bacterium]